MTVNLPRTQRAFTLIELLVVIGIMGLLAAITVPAIKNLKKADATTSATRQLLDDVDRARQLAISRRTTIYMIFCPSNFWNDFYRAGNSAAYNSLLDTEKAKAANLFEKQFVGYTYVTLRNVGDQPGRSMPRYLDDWHVLPEGTFIAQWKFDSPNNYVRITDPSTARFYDVFGFHTTNSIPFPSETSQVNGRPYFTLPYIAFNYLGQLESGQDAYIPLARGSVVFAHGAGGVPTAVPPSVIENPPGNSTNLFNLIHIDWLTGRARLEHQEISGS